MRVPVEVQVWRLSVLFVVGAVSDLLFQSYRAFRAVFRPKRLGHHLLDALAAVILLAGLGATVLIINWGELRMYIPVTIFLGALITHALIGGVIYRDAYRTFVSVQKGLDWGHRRIVTPTVRTARHTARWIKHTLFPPPPPEPPEPPDEGDSSQDSGTGGASSSPEPPEQSEPQKPPDPPAPPERPGHTTETCL